MHIATKTNETDTENKSFKKARYPCNGKVIKTYFSGVPEVVRGVRM